VVIKYAVSTKYATRRLVDSSARPTRRLVKDQALPQKSGVAE